MSMINTADNANNDAPEFLRFSEAGCYRRRAAVQNMTFLVQPNVITKDERAGLQLGH